MFGSGMNFGLGEDIDALRDMVQRWAGDKLAPRAAQIDESNEAPKDLWPQMGELGLLGITADPDFGGTGMGYLAHVVATVFIPIVGFIWAMVDLGILPGTDGANEYGPDPLETA